MRFLLARALFHRGGVILAGVPVGVDPERTVDGVNQYGHDEVVAIVNRRKSTVDRLIDIEDPHAKYLVTRFCLSARYNHLVRGVDPVSVLDGAVRHDKIIHRLLRSCIGLPSDR